MLEVQCAHVRRCFTTNCWVVSDSQHKTVFYEFIAGLMTKVKFDGKTVPIQELGEDTYGEAIGKLTAKTIEEFEVDPKNSAFLFPKEVTYTVLVRYSAARGNFMTQGDLASTPYPITSCDYLLLMSDGSALCGWRQKPS